MIKIVFPWAFDNPWIWPLIGLPLGWLGWHLRHTGARIAVLLLLGTLPYAMLMIGGIEDGCTSADPPARCVGWTLAVVFVIVGITPMWLGSMAAGAWLRHRQTRPKD